jgi:diaminopimelate epimerase
MLTPFYKYHGTGNDFILIDNRQENFVLDGKNVRYLCDRKFGIGADGLILIHSSASAQIAMIYFNADGKESTMCGNGGRCVAALVNRLSPDVREVAIEATDGIHTALIQRTEGHITYVKLKMKDVTCPNGHLENDFILDTGSPHLVRFTDHVEQMDIKTEGSRIRYSQPFHDKGINVDFAEIRNSRLFLRTYERGVEAETLSCGTGTVAAALALAIKQGNDRGSTTVRAPGGELIVHYHRKDNLFTDIWLEGPATFVFTGEINLQED